MQHFKSRLTKIKHVVERFPDQGDIYGYAGITREVLLNAVQRAYDLAQDIPDVDSDNQFVIITLKRRSAAFYESYKGILDSESGRPDEDIFNRFVEDLSALIRETKCVYFICHSGTERVSSELAGLKADVAAFKEFKASYSQEYEDAKNEVAALRELRVEAERLSQETTQCHANAKRSDEAIQERVSTIKEAYEHADEWTSAIEGYTQNIADMRDAFAKMQSDVASMTSDAQKTKEQVDEQQKTIANNLTLTENLCGEAQETLANANRRSMAASFKERKDELLGPMRLWAIALILALCGIASVVLWGPEVKFIGETPMMWIVPMLFRTALIAPCLWLGWYAGRQYGYTVRVREDYSFKYACAVAYEGFKKAADGEDARLGKILLELCMLNMSQQPLRVYAHSKFGVKGLPIEEMIEAVRSKLPHIESFDIKHAGVSLSAKLAGRDTHDGENAEDDT